MAQPAKHPGGRPPKKPITPELERIYLSLLQQGDSDRQAAVVTGIPARTWQHYADRNEKFAALRDKARERRASTLAGLVRTSMREGIKEKHPWFTKLAIWNYPLGLCDHDRRLEQVTADANRQLDLIQKRVAEVVVREAPKTVASKILAEIEGLNLRIERPEKLDADDVNPKRRGQ